LQPISNACTLNTRAVITPSLFSPLSIDIFASFFARAHLAHFRTPGFARANPAGSYLIGKNSHFIKPGGATFLLFFLRLAPTIVHSLF
jgi:hypothetical protein